jgi:hypothetical protein
VQVQGQVRMELMYPTGLRFQLHRHFQLALGMIRFLTYSKVRFMHGPTPSLQLLKLDTATRSSLLFFFLFYTSAASARNKV